VAACTGNKVVGPIYLTKRIISCYIPPNGDRIVTVYSVTSVHPMYSAVTAEQHHKVSTELLLLNATRIKKIELRCLLVEALTNIKCIKSFYISLDHLQATSQQTTAKTGMLHTIGLTVTAGNTVLLLT